MRDVIQTNSDLQRDYRTLSDALNAMKQDNRDLEQEITDLKRDYQQLQAVGVLHKESERERERERVTDTHTDIHTRTPGYNSVVSDKGLPLFTMTKLPRCALETQSPPTLTIWNPRLSFFPQVRVGCKLFLFSSKQKENA